MKINNNIPIYRRNVIQRKICDYNQKFKNDSSNLYSVFRNKIGIPCHAIGFCLGIFIIAQNNFADIVNGLLISKFNLDFITFIKNINKKKACGFSKYMKDNGITDKSELLYGTRKYLIQSGLFLYPFLHPQKTKRIAEKSEYTKSYETGIICTRTDKKSLIDKIKHMQRMSNS